jgi:hypothetical protein
MPQEGEHLRLLQEKRREWFIERCGCEPWFTVWRYVYVPERMGSLWCYLAPVAEAESSLRKPNFNSAPRRFDPGFDEAEDGFRYERYGNAHGFETLIHHRSWDGLHPSDVEIAEEYRLFHNLFRDGEGNFSRVIDRGASDEVVVRFGEDGSIDFSLKPLRRYLAAKQCAIVVGVDWREYSDVELSELGLADRDEELARGDSWTYMLGFGDAPGFDHHAFSRLLGKKVLLPPPIEIADIWPYEREKDTKYEDFMIGVDENGDPITYSCEPDSLGSYFDPPGRNVPHYLTEVHFRREVLDRYYERPDRYRVEDGMLWCGSLWNLSIDNDHPSHVVVYLGDLGRDLPEPERPHWKLHNVPPDELLESETSFRRNRLAQFADPKSPDLLFPRALDRTNAAWEKRFGWPLFKALRGEDELESNRLRIPLVDTVGAFDEQVRLLAKLTVESIDGRVGDLAPVESTDSKPGLIIQLRRALVAEGADPSTSENVERVLKLIHELNNGVRHRKGKRWTAATEAIGLPTTPRPAAFSTLLAEVLKAMELVSLFAGAVETREPRTESG